MPASSHSDGPPNDPKPDITIVPYTPADEAAVVALVNQCYRTAAGWTHEAELVSGPRLTPSQLRRDAAAMSIFVARANDDDGAVVGCIKTGLTAEAVVGPLHEPCGYVGLLAVHPARQSRGLGSALVAHAERVCAAAGARAMVLDLLDVREDIRQWYDRLGYRPTGDAVDAASVIKGAGATVLKPAKFIVLQKTLS